MSCDNCESNRIASFYAKCNDLFDWEYGAIKHSGYPRDGLGLGDNSSGVRLSYCLSCGQIQDFHFVTDEDLMKIFNLGMTPIAPTTDPEEMVVELLALIAIIDEIGINTISDSQFSRFVNLVEDLENINVIPAGMIVPRRYKPITPEQASQIIVKATKRKQQP